MGSRAASLLLWLCLGYAAAWTVVRLTVDRLPSWSILFDTIAGIVILLLLVEPESFLDPG